MSFGVEKALKMYAHSDDACEIKCVLNDACDEIESLRAQLAAAEKERDGLAENLLVLNGVGAAYDRMQVVAKELSEEKEVLRQGLSLARENSRHLRVALLGCIEAIEQPEVQDPRARTGGTWMLTALKNVARAGRKAFTIWRRETPDGDGGGELMSYYLVRYRDNNAWSDWYRVPSDKLGERCDALALRGLGDLNVRYLGKGRGMAGTL
jgi:hypothetical protein